MSKMEGWSEDEKWVVADRVAQRVAEQVAAKIRREYSKVETVSPEETKYAKSKAAVGRMSNNPYVNPVNGAFCFRRGQIYARPSIGTYSTLKGQEIIYLPRPGQLVEDAYSMDVFGGGGSVVLSGPLTEEQVVEMEKRQNLAVTEDCQPDTPPEQMFAEADFTMFSSGSPTPRNTKQEDGDAESVIGKPFKHANSSAAPPPLMISKANANAPTAQGRPPAFKKMAGTTNHPSNFPTESLLALLDKQEAIKTENASVSPVHNDSAPVSRGSKRLSPNALSFDASGSSLAGSIQVGESAQLQHIKSLQSEIEATRQAVKDKQQELDQVRLASHMLDNIISEHSSGDYSGAAYNARPTTTSRTSSWAPAADVSPVEYRPTSGHSEAFLAPNNRSQFVSSGGAAPYGIGNNGNMNFTAMNASMSNMSLGNEWAPSGPATGASMMKAPFANQQMAMGTQAELGNYPRPYFERPSFPPAVAGTSGFPSGPSNFGAGSVGSSAFPVFNDPFATFIGDDLFPRPMGNANNLNNSSRPDSSNSNRGGRTSYPQYQNGTINTYNSRSGWAPAPAYPTRTLLGQASLGAFGSRPAPGPVGSILSPTASEFPYHNFNSMQGPWNPQPTSMTYNDPPEHVNYRRLLERNASCDWNQIVDRIIAHNDQQASIFLQQKLKLGTNEQRFEIVEAIIAQAYMLMINRFGNFLIQRCFEHGTHEQVIKIAQAIQGHTLELSMDSFGCHVIQKAFDAVPENYKAVMVHELLRRIPETVVHRYACHVWQKLFELRWNDSPPQIMRFVNDALRGMWHEVALGETGSLVVQNIFENCLDEDKRPCIDEILLSIDVVAHGQFGNWCIQHICEHGAPKDKKRAIDHILRFASQYSMDQYASKVIEKCLKIGGAEFLQRYLDRVCDLGSEASRGPRIPLIDIASDQFGNYLIQWILINSNAEPLKEIVASHIRKHMVSLRGSKYGSRVAMLCCNPDIVCRPGAPHLAPAPPANRGGTIGNGYGHGHGGYQANHGQNSNNGYRGNGYRNNSNFVPSYR